MKAGDRITLKERLLGVNTSGDQEYVPAGVQAEIIYFNDNGTFCLWTEEFLIEIPDVVEGQVIPA